MPSDRPELADSTTAESLQAAVPPGQDPNDQLDVPPEMYPAELDARGDAVNALREAKGLPVPPTHDEDRGASYA
jgi:hypothetical protein